MLGVLQGLTEFIPVSSSAHLVLAPWFLKWPDAGLVLDTTLHLGTVVALLVVFWSDLWGIAVDWFLGWRRLRWQTRNGRLGWLIIVGTIPAVVIGVAFKEQLEALFSQPVFVGFALLVTAALLTFSEWMGGRNRPGRELTPIAAVVVGLAQALAIMPGISRSGATISAGLLLGLDRVSAARFSFLLGIPIIAGAGASQLLDVVRGVGTSPGWGVLLAGFLAAAISGYLCVRFLLHYLQRGKLYVFSMYCLALGLFTILVWYTTGGKGFA